MDLDVLVRSRARVSEHVGVDAHPASLLAVTPEEEGDTSQDTGITTIWLFKSLTSHLEINLK